MSVLRHDAYEELERIENETSYTHGSTISELANDDDEFMLITEGVAEGYDVFLRIEVTIDFDGDIEINAYMKYDIEGGWWEVI